MYEKDKKTRLTIRLNQDQFDCVKIKADILGISPSDFIRMLINSVLYVEKTQGKAEQVLLGGKGRENDKANLNDIV